MNDAKALMTAAAEAYLHRRPDAVARTATALAALERDQQAKADRYPSAIRSSDAQAPADHDGGLPC